MTRARRLLSPALALLMPLMGLSTLLLPALALDPDPCAAASTRSCCPDEARGPCQAPDRAPSRNGCRTCDGTVQLAPASLRSELEAPAAASATRRLRDASPALRESAARVRLVALTASPPTHILLSTFRN